MTRSSNEAASASIETAGAAMDCSPGALTPAPPIRPAVRQDAALIARLTDMAGEGLPFWLWARMAGPGQTPLDVGTARAARTAGAFSWCNARMATWHGAPVGAVIDYDIDDTNPPGEGVSPVLRPLCELEILAAGSRYVNVLAVLPQSRRRGIARALIEDVTARTTRPLTLVTASANRPARAFYLTLGFEEVARRPIGWQGLDGLVGEWILMHRKVRSHPAASGRLGPIGQSDTGYGFQWSS